MVTLTLTAGSDAIPGEYNVRVQAQTLSRLANVESPEQSFRVVVGAASSWMFLGYGGPLVAAAATLFWLVGRRRK